MATVANLMPKMAVKADVTSSALPTSKPIAKTGKICQFHDKEIDMMPGQWAEPGNPTPYELRVTIHTCKRLWHLNKEALNCIDCDTEATLYNIKVLEKLYIHLMEYLSD
ncbi:MAG: hypothetical protein R3254_10575 [Thiomicrorhabdus sp.]|nr:hypothetical protein [Thiomicrorhabdus sp.]